jgi:hypothetical protein
LMPCFSPEFTQTPTHVSRSQDSNFHLILRK